MSDKSKKGTVTLQASTEFSWNPYDPPQSLILLDPLSDSLKMELFNGLGNKLAKITEVIIQLDDLLDYTGSKDRWIDLNG